VKKKNLYQFAIKKLRVRVILEQIRFLYMEAFFWTIWNECAWWEISWY